MKQRGFDEGRGLDVFQCFDIFTSTGAGRRYLFLENYLIQLESRYLFSKNDLKSGRGLFSIL